jgi:hypothetical protein
MLDPKAYYEIYLNAQRSEKTILEIGTFSGAATIALALGAPEGIQVITLEKFGRFMAARYGDARNYREQLTSIFEKYGVAEKITVCLGEPESIADLPALSNGIGLLMLDADGAIDRDLELFYPLLMQNAPVIIDDYGDAFAHINLGFSIIGIDQKERLARMLTDYFEGSGLIKKEKVIRETYFGHKTGDLKFSKNQKEIMEMYRKLAWGTAKPSSVAFRTTSRIIKKFSPKLHLWLKSKLIKT